MSLRLAPALVALRVPQSHPFRFIDGLEFKIQVSQPSALILIFSRAVS